MPMVRCPACSLQLDVPRIGTDNLCRCPNCGNDLPLPSDFPPATQVVPVLGEAIQSASRQPEGYDEENVFDFVGAVPTHRKHDAREFGEARALVRRTVIWLYVASGTDAFIAVIFVFNAMIALAHGYSPGWGICFGALFLLFFYVFPVVLMLAGAERLRKLRGRGFVTGGARMAFIVAALLLVAVVLFAIALVQLIRAGTHPPIFGYMILFAYIVGAFVNIVAGAAAFAALRLAKVREAFAIRDPSMHKLPRLPSGAFFSARFKMGSQPTGGTLHGPPSTGVVLWAGIGLFIVLALVALIIMKQLARMPEQQERVPPVRLERYSIKPNSC